MYILGDIGNTETKLCLVSNKYKIIKKITFSSKNLKNSQLNLILKKNNIKFTKLKKSLFCSVVPDTFKIIKNFL